MVNILPASSLMRLALAAVAVLLFSTLRGDNGAPKVKELERELDTRLAELEAHDTRPIFACQTDPLLFPYESKDASPTRTLVEEARCDLELLHMLKTIMAAAQEDLEAGRLEHAHRLAMDILRYNNAMPGRRSLLGVAVAAASAKPAVQLLQILAARSSSAEQRLAWRESLERLLAHQLDAPTRTRAILLGEARVLRDMRRQGLLSQEEKDAYHGQIAGYAALLVDLETQGNPFRGCADSVASHGSEYLCPFVVDLAQSEAHIDEQLLLLKEMLARRI